MNDCPYCENPKAFSLHPRSLELITVEFDNVRWTTLRLPQPLKLWVHTQVYNFVCQPDWFLLCKNQH